MSTSDRELLERSAKAAGYRHQWNEKLECLEIWSDGERQTRFWQPHRDDGDALRLANRLGICIEFGYCLDDAPIVRCGPIEERDVWPQEANFPDPNAATRRAIVRAAASIGDLVGKE